MADLKLAVTEAATEFVDESARMTRRRRAWTSTSGSHDDRLVLELNGPPATQAASEQELSRAIIEATVDESHLRAGPHRWSSAQ